MSKIKTPVDMEKLKELTGGIEPANPMGSCFDATAHQFIYWQREDQDAPKEMFIVHGIGIANAPGQEGLKMAHAWIEYYDTYQGKRVCIAHDCIWSIRNEAGAYRQMLKISYSVKYGIEEFMRLYLVHNYPGPWDKKIKKVIGDE